MLKTTARKYKDVEARGELQLELVLKDQTLVHDAWLLEVSRFSIFLLRFSLQFRSKFFHQSVFDVTIRMYVLRSISIQQIPLFHSKLVDFPIIRRFVSLKSQLADSERWFAFVAVPKCGQFRIQKKRWEQVDEHSILCPRILGHFASRWSWRNHRCLRRFCRGSGG